MGKFFAFIIACIGSIWAAAGRATFAFVVEASHPPRPARIKAAAVMIEYLTHLVSPDIDSTLRWLYALAWLLPGSHQMERMICIEQGEWSAVLTSRTAAFQREPPIRQLANAAKPLAGA